MLLHTEDMTWNPKIQQLTIDASDCGLKPGNPPSREISVVSQKTGSIKKFTFFKNIISDGELLGWRFECTDPNVNCSLHILND